MHNSQMCIVKTVVNIYSERQVSLSRVVHKNACVINDVLRKIMQEKGKAPADIARSINSTSRVVTDRLRSCSPTVRTVSEIAGSLGYKLILVPAERELHSDEYNVITAKN